MVPNGWKLTALGDISTNIQTGPFGSQLHAHEYTNEGVAVVMPKDLINNRVNIEDAAKIPESRAADLKKHILKKGDILFSRRGDVARFGLVTDESKGSICGTGCLKVSLNSNHSPLFISYFLQNSFVRKWLEQNAVGQTMLNLNTTILSELPLIVAESKLEQQKIAKILTTWDKAISTTERLVDNSNQQKKALMQQLLTGKKRLLDENGKRFEGEWESSNFSKVFEVANNKNSQVKSSDYLESGTIPIVDQGKKLVPGYTNKQDIYSDTPVIIFGDHTRVVKWVDFNFCQGADGTQVLKPNSILETKFAYYLLSHTPIPNLGYSRHMRELKEKSFKYPIDKLEQQKIAAVLTNADKEIDLLEQQLTDLQQEKKALMQILLMGKKRVRIDEIV